MTALTKNGPVFATVAFMLGAMLTTLTAQPADPAAPIIRQVDHIVAQSSDAPALFALFAETLQLPVAWPLTDYGGFASGGIAIGNVNFEIVRSRRWFERRATARITGFALEPVPLDRCLPELDTRRIPYGSPSPYRVKQADGSMQTRWTTVALPDVSNEATEVFLCEYGHDEPERRRRFREQLRARGGGPLGILSVREIVCGARDVHAAHERWQRLLHPLRPAADGRWQIADGPALRLQPADQDGVVGLVLTIASKAQARQFLEAHQLLDAGAAPALTLAPTRVHGLVLTLEE